MKVNDPNHLSTNSAGASRTQEATRTGQNGLAGNTADRSGVSSSDDIQLSELVRNLRSLAADSPERQAHIEKIARSFADGSYKVDAEATASKIIDDATQGS